MQNARADHDLAFMLRYENVAWYENGQVRILDRRIYPGKIEFVTCQTHQEVAQAITDMVTQSAGPYNAAGMGMALAAYECKDQPQAEQRSFLQEAAKRLYTARPTTSKRMQLVTDACLVAAEQAFAMDSRVDEAIFTAMLDIINTRYLRMEKAGQSLVSLFPQQSKVMTQCFGETIVGMMLREIEIQGKEIKLFCPETRPYFQGARLTATVAADMGHDVTVITDNMPAVVMQQEKIDVFTSAADAICLDGHIVNKVGTLQIAIVAKHFGVPYFVSGMPDLGHPTIETVHIEQRDPEFVLEAMGVRTAAAGVKGYYPSFDITPPHLVSAVATDKGVFSAYDLPRYFSV